MIRGSKFMGSLGISLADQRAKAANSENSARLGAEQQRLLGAGVGS